MDREEDPEEDEEEEDESESDSSSSRALAAAATAAYPTRGAAGSLVVVEGRVEVVVGSSLPFPLASRRAWRAGTSGASSSEEDEPPSEEEEDESEAAALRFRFLGRRLAAARGGIVVM